MSEQLPGQEPGPPPEMPEEAPVNEITDQAPGRESGEPDGETQVTIENDLCRSGLASHSIDNGDDSALPESPEQFTRQRVLVTSTGIESLIRVGTMALQERGYAKHVDLDNYPY